MLALYTADPQHLPKLRAALPPEQEVLLAEDWGQMERASSDAQCSIIHIDRLHTSPTLPQLSAFKDRHPGHPVTLVTRWDPENARCLKDLFVEEVVWFREVEQSLKPAVQRACAAQPNYVRCLAVPFERAERLPSALRAALAHACRSERPVCSVNELATAVGVNRRTLWRQWRKAVASSSALRLQDFLHWLLLLRVTGRKTPDRTWADVAEEVGVHPHTLWRLSKQLAGRTLPEIAADQTVVTQLFREQVLEFLLEGEPLDIL
jgi:transposase-like protein